MVPLNKLQFVLCLTFFFFFLFHCHDLYYLFSTGLLHLIGDTLYSLCISWISKCIVNEEEANHIHLEIQFTFLTLFIVLLNYSIYFQTKKKSALITVLMSSFKVLLFPFKLNENNYLHNNRRYMTNTTVVQEQQEKSHLSIEWYHWILVRNKSTFYSNNYFGVSLKLFTNSIIQKNHYGLTIFNS